MVGASSTSNRSIVFGGYPWDGAPCVIARLVEIASVIPKTKPLTQVFGYVRENTCRVIASQLEERGGLTPPLHPIPLYVSIRH